MLPPKPTTELNKYLMCLDISMAILLGLSTVIIVVRLKYSNKHSFNELTMVPYYFVIAYTVLASI